MIGLRAGLRVGLVGGPRIGVVLDELGGGTAAAPTTTTITGTLADSADPVLTSAAYAYTLDLTNTGAIAALTVSAAITLPTGTSYVASGSGGAGWTLNVVGQVATATRASMDVGAAPTITVNLTAPTSSAGSTTLACTAAITASNVSGTLNKNQNTTLNPNCTKDATTGRYLPQSAAEIAALTMAAVNSLWLFQMPSGNATDQVGSLTLTAAGTPLYDQVVPGWATHGIAFNSTVAQRFGAASGVGPDPSTTSVLWCGLMSCGATPGANRILVGASATATTECYVKETTASHARLTCKNVSATDGTADMSAAAVQLVYIVYDRTHGTVTVYTEQEKIVGTYNAGVTDGIKGFGALSGSSCAGNLLWGIQRNGAAAEMSAAAIKAEMQLLGASPPWS